MFWIAIFIYLFVFLFIYLLVYSFLFQPLKISFVPLRSGRLKSHFASGARGALSSAFGRLGLRSKPHRPHGPTYHVRMSDSTTSEIGTSGYSRVSIDCIVKISTGLYVLTQGTNSNESIKPTYFCQHTHTRAQARIYIYIYIYIYMYIYK